MPTLVIHGLVDALVASVAAGATAGIHGPRLLLYHGMGHDLPRAVWPQLIDRMTALFRARLLAMTKLS